VLLRFRMRQAVALVSLTVFLGSFAPAAAAFCDPHLTERGVLSLPDLPGALVILPCMFYGLSWGVIVNALLPEWLLTLLVCAVLFVSNAELVVAIARLFRGRSQALLLWDRLRFELARSRGERPPPPLLTAAEARARRREAAAGKKGRAAGGGGGKGGPARGSLASAPSAGPLLPATPSSSSRFFAAFRGRGRAHADADSAGEEESARASGGSDSASPVRGRDPEAAASPPLSSSAASAAAAAAGVPPPPPPPEAEKAERAAALARAKDAAVRLCRLRRRAEQIEAIALVYPAFHVPTLSGALARAAERGVRRRWAADGVLAVEGGEEACPDRAAYELLLSGEGDGREQDVAATLARAGTVTGEAALLKAATADLPPLSDADVDAAVAAAAAASAASAPALGASAADAGADAGKVAPSSSPPPPPPSLAARLGSKWRLQCSFEIFLLLKIVVIHLVTDAVRHHTAHPCTPRFWVMLGGLAGAVTALLVAVSVSYARRRLWRGPRWVGGRQLVIDARRREEREEREAATAGDVEGAAAAQEDAYAAPAPIGCWPKFAAWRAAHSPFSPLPARAAIKRLDACNATDGYACWTRGRLLALALVALPIGLVSSAAGTAGGPVQAQLLLLLRLKPHVVAGTSRVLLSAFTLGTAAAYAVSGNLQITYGLVFGLMNLVLAPLGLLAFRRLRLPTHVVLLLSLAMGAFGLLAVAGRRLVPELHLVVAAMGGRVTLPADERFDMSRFCRGTY